MQQSTLSRWLTFVSFFYFFNRRITPEDVGSIIIGHLLMAAESVQRSKINQVVISVPAEFDQQQRNATTLAATLNGI
jgi:molecular chaperone DnaK